MTARWRSRTGLFTILLGVGVLSGCVERRYTVLTDPPSAMVLDNGRPIGPAPVNKPFEYYGYHRLTLQRDGYQTLVVDEDIQAPWYEIPPLDFIAENLLPFTIRDIRELKYTLQPMPNIPDQQLLNRGGQFRIKGNEVAEPLIPPGEVGPPPTKLPGPP